jgi:hypothetical protein
MSVAHHNSKLRSPFRHILDAMATLFTAAALERLSAELLPFGEDWRTVTGRELATLRDGLDFLAMMKDRDELWATLAAASVEPSCRGDLQALRDALPTATPDDEVSVETRLASLGLSGEEMTMLITAIARPEGVGDAIRDAFAAGSPQHVARALEQILDTSPEVIATERHIRRFAGERAPGRVLGTVMGIALFLLGASYATDVRAEDAKEPAAQQAGDKADEKNGKTKADDGAGKAKKPKAKPTKPHSRPGAGVRYKGITPPRRT